MKSLTHALLVFVQVKILRSLNFIKIKKIFIFNWDTIGI